MPIPDGTKIGVSTETPSLYFDSFLIAFVVSIKTELALSIPLSSASPKSFSFGKCQLKQSPSGNRHSATLYWKVYSDYKQYLVRGNSL